jgi:hypothetical protein
MSGYVVAYEVVIGYSSGVAYTIGVSGGTAGKTSCCLIAGGGDAAAGGLGVLCDGAGSVSMPRLPTFLFGLGLLFLGLVINEETTAPTTHTHIRAQSNSHCQSCK